MNRIRHAGVRNEHREYVQYVGEVAVESPVQTLVGDELADCIQAAIQKLPEQCRHVFMLSRFDGLRYGEIADRLRISIKTVENQIGKTLRILRNELSAYLPVLLIMNTIQWIMENVAWLNSIGQFHSQLHSIVFIIHFSFLTHG